MIMNFENFFIVFKIELDSYFFFHFFRYQKVSLSEIKKIPTDPVMMTGSAVVTRKRMVKRRGRPRKYTITSGTDMIDDAEIMFTPGSGKQSNEDDEDDEDEDDENESVDSPKPRDQEELNIVESAFKVSYKYFKDLYIVVENVCNTITNIFLIHSSVHLYPSIYN